MEAQLLFFSTENPHYLLNRGSNYKQNLTPPPVCVCVAMNSWATCITWDKELLKAIE